MNSSERMRRATLDDLEKLMVLWKSMGFDADYLAKRVTEFQVAEAAGGELLGAVGLQVSEKQGLIHSEAFIDHSQSEALRPELWERIRAVAVNHGLFRLWTREQAPFWSRCGLVRADAETLKKLPALWRNQASDWLTIKLKEELEAVLSLDKEFAIFMQSEKQKSERALQRAKALKNFATLLGFVLFGLVMAGVFYLIMKNPRWRH